MIDQLKQNAESNLSKHQHKRYLPRNVHSRFCLTTSYGGNRLLLSLLSIATFSKEVRSHMLLLLDGIIIKPFSLSSSLLLLMLLPFDASDEIELELDEAFGVLEVFTCCGCSGINSPADAEQVLLLKRNNRKCFVGFGDV